MSVAGGRTADMRTPHSDLPEQDPQQWSPPAGHLPPPRLPWERDWRRRPLPDVVAVRRCPVPAWAPPFDIQAGPAQASLDRPGPGPVIRDPRSQDQASTRTRQPPAGRARGPDGGERWAGCGCEGRGSARGPQPRRPGQRQRRGPTGCGGAETAGQGAARRAGAERQAGQIQPQAGSAAARSRVGGWVAEPVRAGAGRGAGRVAPGSAGPAVDDRAGPQADQAARPGTPGRPTAPGAPGAHLPAPARRGRDDRHRGHRPSDPRPGRPAGACRARQRRTGPSWPRPDRPGARWLGLHRDRGSLTQVRARPMSRAGVLRARWEAGWAGRGPAQLRVSSSGLFMILDDLTRRTVSHPPGTHTLRRAPQL